MLTSMALRIASIIVIRGISQTPAFCRCRRRCGGMVA